MIKEIDIVIAPHEADNETILKKIISEESGFDVEQINGYKILKRSIDARSRNIKIQLKVQAYFQESFPEKKISTIVYPNSSNKEKVIIAGAGPAGLFAALRLIELGKKPVIIERGKNVKDRRRDLAAINKQHIVNPDSNYCFGEGGAGTYSDGKLYTRSKKRGDVSRILDIFVAHGANEDILTNAHPHIGTNKLPDIIASMRETILNAGGEIHFNTRITDFIIEKNVFKGVITLDEKEFLADNIILATGHSARDIFKLLHKKNILIEAKPFAMGVRVEHPQSLIDSIQYHCPMEEVENTRKHLPAAAYSLVTQVHQKGIYSFCMCPGGIIAPCATDAEQVVTNGWSPSKRNNPFANSGLVVSIELADLKKYAEHGALAGMYYQQELEKMAFEAGGKTQTAPAQRLLDFIQNKTSETLPECSYQPGIKSAALHELLSAPIRFSLQEGLKFFGKKMPKYLTNEAVIVGVETRTSSPVKIPRDKETLEHPQIKGFYPCGEGAGYAGGIVSAAIDGEKCAEAIAQK